MSEGRRPLGERLTEWGGDLALKFGAWFLSVAVLNFLVGSPVTDLYVGFSIVAAAMWVGWRASRLFDEPPAWGTVRMVDPEEARYAGEVTADGTVTFSGPDGRRWSGSAWSGRWTVEDPDGRSWWGRVARDGRVTLHDEDGRELHGTLTQEETGG